MCDLTKKKNTFIKDIAEKIPPVSSILKATCFHTEELLRTWLRMFAGFVHMATGLNKLFLCSSEWGGCCELRPGGTTAGQISCPKGDRRELILWSSWELRRKKNQPGFSQAGFQNLTLTRSWKWLEGTEHPRKSKGQDFALWQIALR